jgi:hypothetical protein
MLVLLLVSGVGCDEAAEVANEASEAIGEGAEEVQEGIDLAGFCVDAAQAADAIDEGDFGEALDHATAALGDAPDDIRPALETLVDAARQYADGDAAAIDEDEVRAAAEEVETYARERCDPR